MNGDFQLAWDMLQPLIIAGFTIGVVMAIIFGAIKIGWQFAPYIFLGAMLVWFLT
mgnify:CR=1 FL=1|jgi:hypothetical protein